MVGAGRRRDPGGDQPGDVAVLRRVGVRRPGRCASSIDVGIEWVTNTSRAPSRHVGRQPASAATVLATIASTKPGWLK